ncbi:hypothetical protein FRC12_002136 [Ceratobasidium sp. 428]|nr:hypothetical protein FRC12_002136 [Ceratobasidium sp. 428]
MVVKNYCSLPTEILSLEAHSSRMAAYPAIAPNLGYIMNISLSERAYDRSKGNYWKDAGICSPKMLTIPAQNVKTGLQLDSFDNGGDFDMFDVYTCDVGPNTTLLDARYNINIRANGSSSSLDGMVLPQIWLNIGTPDELLPHYNVSYMHGITPWLVPSWQLAAGIHSIAEMSMAKRKFIESPFLRDTLGGMKPKYQSITLFPIDTIHERSLNMSLASGTITPSNRTQFSSSNTRQNINKLRTDVNSLPQTCEVIEDYRAGTAFDAIGSIGGLLAILQGLHVLLFGRPIFWGIFGAKLLTPFGLLGGLSSAGFRRRLQEHYYSKADSCELDESSREDTIRLHAFLRDYVIDFGPADSRSEGDSRLLA